MRQTIISELSGKIKELEGRLKEVARISNLDRRTVKKHIQSDGKT
jgi:hypothetical protein